MDNLVAMASFLVVVLLLIDDDSFFSFVSFFNDLFTFNMDIGDCLELGGEMVKETGIRCWGSGCWVEGWSIRPRLRR